MPDDSASSSASSQGPRFIAACAIMGIVVLVSAASAFTSELRVCEQSDNPASCRPLTWSDPPILLGVVLAAFVGFPYVRRVEAGPGGVSADVGKPAIPETAGLTQRLDEVEGKLNQLWPEDDEGEGDGNDDAGTTSRT